MEFRMVRKDGRVIWVSEAWRVVEDDGAGHRAFQGLVYDVTERRWADDALHERAERLSSIIDTQRDVAAVELDLHSVMDLICERTEELTNAGAATILLFDGEGFAFSAATGFITDRLTDRVPLEGTLTGWVHEHGRATICDDTLTDDRMGPLAAKHGIRSMAVVPLRHGDENIGQLQVLSDQPGAFNDEDVSTLELLSVVL